MANFGMFGGGLTLKALLENPELQTAPTSNNSEEKKKKDADGHFDSGSAFLGPNLWDKTYDNIDINLEYMDLDEFLSENGIPINGDPLSSPDMSNLPSPGVSQSDSNQSAISVSKTSGPMLSPDPCSPCSPRSPCSPCSPAPETTSPPPTKAMSPQPSSPKAGQTYIDFTVSPDDMNLINVQGEENFDPTQRHFSEEELKPQPMIKKSRKVFVHDEAKDDKYWARRKKNNYAAKRSRDARRIKENQIAMRASFLEKENSVLRAEMDKMKAENSRLKTSLAKYEPATSS